MADLYGNNNSSGWGRLYDCEVLHIEGFTALMMAVWKGHAATAAMLINRGANVNARHATPEDAEYYGGWTALTSAAQMAYLDVVDLLLRHGADVNAQDDAGNSVLMRCIQCSQKIDVNEREGYRASFVKLLLEHGADVNQKNISGRTVLDDALDANDTEIVTLLRKYGAKRGIPHRLTDLFKFW